MDRRCFLKTCLGGVIGAVAVPAVIYQPKDLAIALEVYGRSPVAGVLGHVAAMNKMMNDMLLYGMGGVVVADDGSVRAIDWARSAGAVPLAWDPT